MYVELRFMTSGDEGIDEVRDIADRVAEEALARGAVVASVVIHPDDAPDLAAFAESVE